MADTRLTIPEDLYNHIKVISGKTGKKEGDVLRALIIEAERGGKSLEEIVEEMRANAEIVPPRGRGRPPKTLGYRAVVLREPAERQKKDPLDRVADKMEKILGIKLMSKLVNDLDLNPSEAALVHGRNPGYPRQPLSPQKTDIMAFVKEVKALEMLDKQTSDPEVKLMLKELKDAQVKMFKDIEKPPSARQDLRRRLDELKEYAMTMRIFGTPEEAKKADRAVQNELKEMRKELHNAQLGSLKDQMKWQSEDFQRKIDEIKNTPSEFDQIARISALSTKDPAVKAYLHQKLGISAKKGLTPESIAKTIKEIQVPVGDLIDGVIKAIRATGKAPTLPPPPPPTPIPTEIPEVPPTPIEEIHLPPEGTPEIPIEIPIPPTPTPPIEPTPTSAPRRRGRPLGSKNKPKEG